MRALKWFLLVLYAATLTYIVFFARRRDALVWHSDLVNIMPIEKTIESFQSGAVRTKDVLANLFGNILLFVPLPFFLMRLLRVCDRTTIIVLGLIISLFIELVQYAWRIGVPDIDDVLLNVSGVVLGIFMYKTFLNRSYSKSFLL